MGGTDFRAFHRDVAGRERPTSPIPEGGCYVYGAGGFGRRVARELVRLGLRVIAFIDVTARERPAVDGLPCLHPDDLGDVGEAAYVHGLMNHATSPRSVVAWAAARGFSALRFPVDLYAIPGFTLENYWLTPAQETRTNRDALAEFHDRLEDPESREALRRLVAYRLSTDPRDHPEVSVVDAYVPRFLPIFAEAVTFIDGGAYSGDTLETLLANRVAVADWIAFEPDGRNMAALRATAHRHRGSVGGYTLIQAGLSDTNGVVRFAADLGAASRIVSPGEVAGADASWTRLDVVRLDDTIGRSGPLYVKLDIEGAETDALHGMRRILGLRPTMAVSLYHRPSDLWEIPRVIAALYPQPRFRLRQHGHHGFDAVLYVMPA